MNSENKKLIWDLPTRVFHWALVAAITYSWYSIEIKEDLNQHFISGYCVLALVMFRWLWGFWGTKYARFSSFRFSPESIKAGLGTILSRKPCRKAGHTALGSLSVFVLLGLISLQVLTGLFSNDGYSYGPLSHYISAGLAAKITEFHEISFNVLLAFIVLHILAILFYWLYKRENLISAMFTGKKRDIENNFIAIENSKLKFASMIFIFCILGVFALIYTRTL